MWEKLKAEVRRDYTLFDDQVRSWIAGYETGNGRIHCRRGCRNCCSLAVSATFTEALCVAGTVAESSAGKLAEHAGRALAVAAGAADLQGWLRGYSRSAGPCPFLEEDGACGVYSERPFSCRALLATRNPEWCGVDLSQLHPLEKQAFLSGLDRSVVAWPSHYAAVPQETGLVCETRASVRMAQAFGFSIAGNLPLLVWLEREYRLSDVIFQGRMAVASLLERVGINRPFLVEVRD